MSDLMRVPRALKKRSKRTVLSVAHATEVVGDETLVPAMGRKSFKEKKRSFRRGAVKERWLLTRKTWKFMADAGRRLLPDGAAGNKADDIPKIEKYFQEVCRNEPKFLVWRRKCSFPGAMGAVPARRWKQRFVSQKMACSADEAEDDYSESLEEVKYDLLLLDMLKNYLDIKDDDLDTDGKTIHPSFSPSTSKPLTASSMARNMGRTTMDSTGNEAQLNCSKQSGLLGNVLSSPWSDDESIRPSSESYLMCPWSRESAISLRRCRGSFVDRITPEMLNDKVYLRKLYEQLRQAHSLEQYRIPSPMAQYQRSALGIHTTFAFPELCGKSKSHAKGPTSNSSVLFSTQGFQTDAISLATLNELSAGYKKHVGDEDDLLRDGESVHDDVEPNYSKNNDRRNSEDVSQSVSDTIKRYLRMARKKPAKDDANRFKRINYDSSLRNIKAKGETTKIGDDDGNCKGCQTDYDWIVKAFPELSTNAPYSISVHRPTTLPRSSKSCGKPESSIAMTPTSSPPSPGISSNIFHTSTQFLTNLFGHAQTSGSGTTNCEASSNDSIYGYSDAAMQKSKSSSNVGHIVSRKIWKSRSKSQSRPVALAKPKWSPEGNCLWTSNQGHSIKLRGSNLNELTEVERKILYQIAVGKINQFNLGINTDSLIDSSPGRSNTQKPAKRKALLLKRKALTTGFFDSNKDDGKGRRVQGQTFGIALKECVENERKGCSDHQPMSMKSDRRARNSLSSLLDQLPDNFRTSSGRIPDINPADKCSGSCESLPSNTQQLSDSGLLKGSLSQFDVRRHSSSLDDDETQLEGLHRSIRPQVPRLVITCVKHLEDFGLHSEGIFRKSASKKRVRQLRENFDNDINFELDNQVCVDDVATLLKEYLRDLPEPLLCRRLYQPFVNTQKIRNRRLQFEAISYLVQVLPVPHRDTLHYLLKFLAKVARFAEDVKSLGGDVISEGNKMDSNNLATVFAPNILHNVIPGQGTTEQEVEERLDVINVIRIMIDHYEEMYKISPETVDEIFLNMIDSHPAQLDILCDRLDFKVNKGLDSSRQQTTAEILEANKQKRLYAREEFLHQNSSKNDRVEVQVKPLRKYHRGTGTLESNMRSTSIDTENNAGSMDRGRRMSSPFNNVLSASLKIPVQSLSFSGRIGVKGGEDIANIPYVEDHSDSSGWSSKRETSADINENLESRKSSSSGTVTGTLSLVQSPSLTISPSTSNSTSPDYRSKLGQVFFGDHDFKEHSSRNKETGVKLNLRLENELQKSSSSFTAGPVNKKLFDTKVPHRQKLTTHHPKTPQNIPSLSQVQQRPTPIDVHKSTSITSIGADLLRSKTADFERFGQHIAEPRTYKRNELISSARNSTK